MERDDGFIETTSPECWNKMLPKDCRLPRYNLNLTTGLFKPYSKTSNIPWYANAKSNHPPAILKEIPKSISKHILSSSCFQKFSMLLHHYITTF